MTYLQSFMNNAVLPIRIVKFGAQILVLTLTLISFQLEAQPDGLEKFIEYHEGTKNIKYIYYLDSDSVFQYKLLKYWENGMLNDSFNVKDDEKHGWCFSYYDNGQLEMEGEFINGKRTGIYKEFWPNGNPKKRYYLEAGDKIGKQYWYHENGQLGVEEFYKQGLISKKKREYNKQGKVISKAKFAKGQAKGRYWYSTPYTKIRGKHKDDLKVGKWKYQYGDTMQIVQKFTKSSKLIKKETRNHNTKQVFYNFDKCQTKINYVENKKVSCEQYFKGVGKTVTVLYQNEGKQIYKVVTTTEGSEIDSISVFNSEGKKDSVFQVDIDIAEIYDHQILHGAFKKYYPSGKLQIETNYDNNKLSGNYKSYYESGQLKVETQYVNNHVVDEYKSYYPDGRLKYLGVFIEEENVFRYKHFDEHNLEQEVDYTQVPPIKSSK